MLKHAYARSVKVKQKNLMVTDAAVLNFISTAKDVNN